MDEKELEPLLKGLVDWAKEMTARQDALESILSDKKLISDQEWNKALQSARQRISIPSQSAIKKVSEVAKFFGNLAKH